MGNFDDLEKEVIEKGLCTHCGACCSVCPDYNVTWGDDDRPHRDEARGMCEKCDECYKNCHSVPGHFKQQEMDEFVHGRIRKEEETVGIYQKIISARACDPEILELAQDGGIASAIALFLLEEKKVDGVITTKRSEINGSWKPIPFIAKTREDIIKSAGTKYGIAPILSMLKEGVIDEGLDRLAVIGLPCQVKSARFLMKNKNDYSFAITELIGLFCTKNYIYDKIKYLIKEKGIKLSEVNKLNVKNNAFRINSNRLIMNVPLKNMEKFVHSFCSHCTDYSAEFADVSIGSQGSEQGWSTVIIRTEKGEKLINRLMNKGYIETKSIENPNSIRSSSLRKAQKSTISH